MKISAKSLIFSHPKCYANRLNNCSTKISGEHIISNNILELFEHNKRVKLAGFSWMEKESFNLLSRKSLTANILCTDHNHALSPYDTEAGRLFRSIKEFDKDFNNEVPSSEYVKLNGLYIEKWMLKIVCGMIASNQMRMGGEKIAPVMKDVYLDLLFNNKPWEEHWGFYFKIPEKTEVQKYDCMSFMPMLSTNEVKAAEFLIDNFKFYLILGKPDDPTYWGFHRLNKIHFSKATVTKTLEFDWDDTKYSKEIELKRVSSSKNPPQEWDNWMNK